ncbi:MAG TPA: dTMP kinase [Oscillatoriales cyanobacterium M59_W2019_021]|nr:dTMP kinase [Oscillatoriales cyanobacterium M4454_W2019_049]HIK51657.1 dTMP kinase [Oscillatoriales cyanobacterium M59_W2019_021]
MDGKFIVFEGVEGCGKTTQIERTSQWLSAQNTADAPMVTLTREPGGTQLGSALRQVLLESQTSEPLQDRAELLLYAADRAQHVHRVLKPQLDKGGIVLCDRYIDSTIAYQGYGRGLSLELIVQINYIATDGLTGDLTLWLDVAPEIALARAKRRGNCNRMEEEDLTFHRRVQQGYAALARAYPQRIARIDASASEDDVQTQIQTVLAERFPEWLGN